MFKTIAIKLALVTFCLNRPVVKCEFVGLKCEGKGSVNNTLLKSELTDSRTSGNITYGSKHVTMKLLSLTGSKGKKGPKWSLNQAKSKREPRNVEESDSNSLSKFETLHSNITGDSDEEIPVIDVMQYEESTFGLDSVSDWNVYNKGREYAFEITKPEDSPYSVMLFNFNERGQRFGPPCSGTLLTPEWVLTAAYCFNSSVSKVHTVTVYAGGFSENEFLEGYYPEGSQVLNSSMIITHPDYKRDEYDVSHNDIAVVKTAGNFTMTTTVNVIPLSGEPWGNTKYTECKLSGFGKVLKYQSNPEDYVRKTYFVQVKSPCRCFEILKDKLGLKKLDRWICAWPRKNFGVCEGDFGAGLICDGEIKAVTSVFVSVKSRYSCQLKRADLWDCGNENSFSVYQNTCPYIKWINQHVRVLKDNEISDLCGLAVVNRSSLILLILSYYYSSLI